MMKSGAPPDKLGFLYRLLPIEFHGFTGRIDSKGCHPLIPGLISIFRDGMGPFKQYNIYKHISSYNSYIHSFMQ